MWMLNFNGGWQPADNDAVVIEWIRQGTVGPHTPARHSSWSNPMPLGQVPAFAGFFGPPLSNAAGRFTATRSPAKQAGMDPTTKALLWVLGMFVALFFIRALGATSYFAGALAVVLAVSALFSVIAVKKALKVSSAVQRAGELFSRHMWLFAGWSGAVLLGGIWGLANRHDRVSQCEQAVAFFADLRDKESLPVDEALAKLADWRNRSSSGHAACALADMRKEVAGLDAVDAEIARMQSTAQDAARQKKERDDQEAALAAAAAREKRAVETFPSRARDIEGILKSASTHASQGKWEDAAQSLDLASKALDEFSGTTISKSKGWADLASKLSTQRDRIKPQLDRINEQRRAAQAKLDAEANLRGPQPIQSSWDGDVLAVRHYLKEVLKDPDSYQADGCTKPRAEGAFWVVECKYRAKNSFGALVLEVKRFFIQSGGLAGEGRVVRTEDLE